MLGAILGDIVGSVYEFHPTSDINFPLLTKESIFTDDTICTIAIADAFMNRRPYASSLVSWCSKYPTPMGGYGGMFLQWLKAKRNLPYFSFGNGSAMRVSSIGWLCDDENEVLAEATYSAACTHNHPEGIKGAQATAMAIFLARNGMEIVEIVDVIESMFGYEIFGSSLDQYRGKFEGSCQGTIPAAFLCLLGSDDFESAIRKAILLRGDADTLGAIVGGIAEALYGIPQEFADAALNILPPEMRKIYQQFKSYL